MKFSNKAKAVVAVICLVILGFIWKGKDGKKSNKNETKPTSSSEVEKKLLKTSEFYVSNVIGNEGPIIYIIGWVHDGSVGMRISKEELRVLLDQNKSRPVKIAFEGFPSGEKLEAQHDSTVSRKIKEIITFARTRGAQLYGGDNKQMMKATFMGYRYIAQKTGKVPDEEICTFFYSAHLVSRSRTQVLLRTLKTIKTSSQESLVVGMMGMVHFEKRNLDILHRFARKEGVRIVLRVWKSASGKNHKLSWPEKQCGDIKINGPKYRKNLRRYSKEAR